MPLVARVLASGLCVGDDVDTGWLHTMLGSLGGMFSSGLEALQDVVGTAVPAACGLAVLVTAVSPAPGLHLQTLPMDKGPTP